MRQPQLLFRLSVVALITLPLSFAATPNERASTAPAVDLKVSLEKDAVERGDEFPVFVLVENHSARPLIAVRIRLLNNGLGLTGQSIGDVDPFGSKQVELKGKVDAQEDFGSHHLTFLLSYLWEDNGKRHESTQDASATLVVNHPFEEEMKGLPGGSGALLYLFLPVLPVFFAYQIVDSLRKGQGFHIPEFKSDYLLPSFLIAIGLNFLLVASFKQQLGEAYSNAKTFAVLMALSALGGAAIPTLGWLYQRIYWRFYAFGENDLPEIYLRKALAASKSSRLPWVTGEYDGQTWQGFLLHQPDGTCVLGAQVEISTKGGSPSYDDLKQMLGGWQIADRKKLLDWVNQRRVNLALVDQVKQGQQGLSSPAIVLAGVKTLNRQDSSTKPLVKYAN